VTVAPGTVADVTFELGADVLARTAAAHGGAIRLHVGPNADAATHRTILVG
jgi:hypothetical protein